jgi:hypothetical protein
VAKKKPEEKPAKEKAEKKMPPWMAKKKKAK